MKEQKNWHHLKYIWEEEANQWKIIAYIQEGEILGYYIKNIFTGIRVTAYEGESLNTLINKLMKEGIEIIYEEIE